MTYMSIIRLFPYAFLMVALVCPFLCSCDDDDDEVPTAYCGHDFVDLGLPSGLLWATCNVGASSPVDAGGFYAWGETSTKSTYTRSNYFDSNNWNDTNDDPVFNTYYCGSHGATQLLSEDDVATKDWGGRWSIPTVADFRELVKYCKWVRTDHYKGRYVYGVICYKNKGGGSYDVETDTHIFIPVSGYRYGSSAKAEDVYGLYWTKSLYTKDGSSCAYNFIVDMEDDEVGTSWNERKFGFNIRPVIAK